MVTLIKGGRVIDPSTKTDEVMDILIKDEVIVARGANLLEELESVSDLNKMDGVEDASIIVDDLNELFISVDDVDEIIEADNQYVMPGLIDLHVHLREPGFEHKETIETGTKAMAKGGFTSVCPMPNTKPATDCVEVVKYIVDKAKEVSPINVLPVGAITIGQYGKEITDIAAMKEAGIYAISEDGKSVMNSGIYREAMKEAARLGIPVLAHCEDINLVCGGAMNAGKKAEALGIKGISNAVEDIITARDIMLAKETGATLHLCHCSTEDSVRMIKEAKAEGLKVTGEVCPHHFTLCEDDIVEDDSNYKMNPPIRSRQDLEALIKGIGDDTFDAISTDHAPHHADEKAKGMATAPFGIVGSETAVELTMTELVHKGVITPYQMAEKMSYNPACILGIDKGSLNVGKVADITIIDPEREHVIRTSEFISLGKNTPFDGYRAKGVVVRTIVAGKTVYSLD